MPRARFRVRVSTVQRPQQLLLVCKRWNSVDARSRHRLLLAARSEISPALPAILSRFTAVSALSLKCSRKLVSIDDHGLSLIPARLVSLRKLKLKGCVDVSDDGLHAFSLNCPPLLSKISLASCGFGARGVISLLYNCPSLRASSIPKIPLSPLTPILTSGSRSRWRSFNYSGCA